MMFRGRRLMAMIHADAFRQTTRGRKLAHGFLWEYSYKRLKLAQKFWANLVSFSLGPHQGQGGLGGDVRPPQSSAVEVARTSSAPTLKLRVLLYLENKCIVQQHARTP